MGRDSDSDSDAAFDQFLREEQAARERGTKKRRRKRVKSVCQLPRPSHTISPDQSSSSENEFDNYIRSLGTLKTCTPAISNKKSSHSDTRQLSKKLRQMSPSTSTRNRPSSSTSPTAPSTSSHQSQSNLASVRRRPRATHTQTRFSVSSSSTRSPPHTAGADRSINHVISSTLPSASSSAHTATRNSSSDHYRSNLPRNARKSLANNHQAVSRPTTSRAPASPTVDSIVLSDDEVIHLSPRTIAAQRQREDELIARSLQEQMDREYAASLRDEPSPHPPSHLHSPAPPILPIPPPLPMASSHAQIQDSINHIIARSRQATQAMTALVRENPVDPRRRAHNVYDDNDSTPLIWRAQQRRRRSGGNNAAARRRADRRVQVVQETYENLLQLQDQIGEAASRGLSASELELLPTKSFKRRPGEADIECTICCDDFSENDVIRILTCFHEFHDACVKPWLQKNRTCPICRVEIQLG